MVEAYDPPSSRELQQRPGSSRKSSNCFGETMEKRLPIAMVVNLTPVQNQATNGGEMTYTDNVSAHGACVVSNRSWQSGEVAEVTSLLDQVAMRGKVAYCRKHGEDRYSIGLTFQNCAVVWSVYLKYASRTQETVAPRQRLAR